MSAPIVTTASVNSSAALSTDAAPSPKIAQFTQHMADAETMYKEFGSISSSEKEGMHKSLCEAYKLYTELAALPETERLPNADNQLARLLFLEGRYLYGGPFLEASHLFNVALLLQLQGEGTNTLLTDDFRKDLASAPDLETLIKTLAKRHESGTLPKLDVWLDRNTLKLTDKPELALQVGIGMRWLGHCYQNVKDTNQRTPQNIARFRCIYGDVHEILKPIAESTGKPIHKEANWELAELHYNTDRFMHWMEHPEDTKGAVKCLEKVIPYLNIEGDTPRAHRLNAQIRNILAIEGAKERSEDPSKVEGYLALTKTCFDNVSKACSLAEKDGFDRFLKHMFLNNRAAFALDSLERGTQLAEMDAIAIWSKQAVDYARTENFNHVYHSTFLTCAARVAMQKNEFETAKRLLEEAVGVCTKFPNSSTDTLTKIEALKQKLPDSTKKVPTSVAVDTRAGTAKLTDDHKITRDCKELVIALVIVALVSAVFIAIGIALNDPFMISGGALSAMSGGLLLFRWHYHTPQGLNTSTHYGFAAVYPTAIAVAAIGISMFSPIPATIFGVMGGLLSIGAVYKGETAPQPNRATA